MNGHANCIYEICCPPKGEQQVRALAEEMMKAFGWDDAMTAYQVNPLTLASWVVKTFDLAPAGSLLAFKTEIARLARENLKGAGSPSPAGGQTING